MAEHDPEKVSAILREYAETLEVLTINSKPLINDLTMAADRYLPLAPQIVAKIEARLFEVSCLFRVCLCVCPCVSFDFVLFLGESGFVLFLDVLLYIVCINCLVLYLYKNTMKKRI